MKLLKPKVVSDIQTTSKGVFNELDWRVNLSYRRNRHTQFKAAAKYLGMAIAAAFLLTGYVSAPVTEQTMAQTVASSSQAADQERQALEAQLQVLQTQMDAYQTQISGYQKQGNSLKGEISQLNSKIAQVNLQIKAINLTLTQLDANIADTASQIKSTEESINTNQDGLKGLLQELYASERTNLLQIFLEHPKLSDFFSDINSLDTLQNNVRLTIIKIKDLQGQLKDQQNQLAAAKADASSVKQYQVAVKSQVEDVKSQKNNLLTVTKGQESKYQALLTQTKQTAAQIRNRIFQLLGGGQLSFEDAYKYAKLAGDATGVRPAMILAVLDRESALGQNVGKCSYQTSMSPNNQKIFLALIQQLNISADTVMVSCANKDGVYGGAMGPAQFVPATWQLYSDQISKITGHSPASPWNNADAFVATALYLKDAGAAGNPTIAQERIAAARYYAGSHWSSYLWTYGQAVVSLAANFQNDIDTITSSN
ncbi:MAG TPA: lytic murein transglycosylase [Candidatus Paceibacterota bacterium]|nr:lytic murein transglycosylase [Candidatus Paceibacterota bacterium]